MKSVLSRAVAEKIADEKTTQEGFARSVGLSQATLSRIVDGAIPSGVPLIRVLSSFDVTERQEILESLVAQHTEQDPEPMNIPDQVLQIINTFTEELEEVGIYHEKVLSFFRVYLLELFKQHHQVEDKDKEPNDRTDTSAQSLAKLTSELATYEPRKLEEYTKLLLRMTEHIKGLQP